MLDADCVNIQTSRLRRTGSQSIRSQSMRRPLPMHVYFNCLVLSHQVWSETAESYTLFFRRHSAYHRPTSHMPRWPNLIPFDRGAFRQRAQPVTVQLAAGRVCRHGQVLLWGYSTRAATAEVTAGDGETCAPPHPRGEAEGVQRAGRGGAWRKPDSAAEGGARMPPAPSLSNQPRSARPLPSRRHATRYRPADVHRTGRFVSLFHVLLRQEARLPGLGPAW